jgi:hypothetical protein
MVQCSLNDDSQNITVLESFWHTVAAKFFESLRYDVFSATSAGKQRNSRQKELRTMSANERRPVFRICALRMQYVSHGQHPGSVSRALKWVFGTGNRSFTDYS